MSGILFIFASCEPLTCPQDRLLTSPAQNEPVIGLEDRLLLTHWSGCYVMVKIIGPMLFQKSYYVEVYGMFFESTDGL